jgi:choline dehydrogenase
MAKWDVTLVNGLAKRVVFEGGRAVGVEIARRTDETIRANREVILAASSINTPKILMLSGIGPGAHLRDHGIEVRADRPGVGQNLQDHLEVYMQYASKKPITLYRYWNLLGKAWVGAQWLFTRTGHGASNQFESCAFIRSQAGVEYPDIQFHFLPIAVRYDGKAAAEGHGFQAHVGPMRSKSRGAVMLASTDPADPPRITFNYMSHDEDWQDWRRAVRLTREIFRQPAMEEFVKHEIQPGGGDTDGEIDAFVREHAESAYHPCGTARMGAKDDPNAVVDPECRVIGVEGLRVADSSIFPRITNGNTNAPSILVGEKAADHVLGRTPLPRDNRGPWINPDWRTAQR